LRFPLELGVRIHKRLGLETRTPNPDSRFGLSPFRMVG
jgi:hypothetical protein